MAYPTGMLSLTLEDFDRRAINLKSYCTRRRAEMTAGNVPSTTILDVLTRLIQDRVAFAAAMSPELAQYARDQKNDQGLDVVAEAQAMVAALDDTAAWVTANFPKDGSGFLLAQTFGPTGPVDRQFTPAQTATFRTVLDALIATIA